MTRRQFWHVMRPVVLALLVLLFILLFPSPVSGEQIHGDQHDLVANAKELQLNLEYEGAQKLLQKHLETQPADLRALNLLGTVILYREMFRRGLLESQLYGKKGEIFKPKQEPLPADFQQELFQPLDKAQAAADARLKNDPKDKDALYWAGVTHGTRATYQFALRRAYLAALREAKEATRHHQQLAQLDPNYVDALLIVGVNDYVVGSLPWLVKMMAALAGAHGDKQGGLEKVERVAQSGNYAREDAKFMLAILLQREKLYPEALAAVQELAAAHPRNFLLQLELAGVYRDMNDMRRAAGVYDALLTKYRAGDYPRLPAAKVMYFSGQAHESLHEPDQALALYEEAGRLPGDSPYVQRAQQAAMELSKQTKRAEARK